jgi:spore germination cell wall hydrolase CwlJ-like protein
MFKKMLLTFALLFCIVGGSNNAHATPHPEVVCLAQNIYFEAGNQPEKGKIAVSAAVMNRIKDGRFGSTACEVIHQRHKRSCQFSWVCNHSRIRDVKLYNSVLPLAERVYAGNYKDPTNGAMYFRSINLTHHNRYAIVIGKLLFYKV